MIVCEQDCNTMNRTLLLKRFGLKIYTYKKDNILKEKLFEEFIPEILIASAIGVWGRNNNYSTWNYTKLNLRYASTSKITYKLIALKVLLGLSLQVSLLLVKELN